MQFAKSNGQTGEVRRENGSNLRFIPQRGWRDLQSKRRIGSPKSAFSRASTDISLPRCISRAQTTTESTVSNRFLPQGDNSEEPEPQLEGQNSLNSLFNLISISDPSRGAQKSSTPKSKCCIKAYFSYLVEIK